jgi:hypothetical protein
MTLAGAVASAQAVAAAPAATISPAEQDGMQYMREEEKLAPGNSFTCRPSPARKTGPAANGSAL